MQTMGFRMVCTATRRAMCGQAAVMGFISGTLKEYCWARSGLGWRPTISHSCLVPSWSLRMRSFGLWKMLQLRGEKCVETLACARKGLIQSFCLIQAHDTLRGYVISQDRIKLQRELTGSLRIGPKVQKEQAWLSILTGGARRLRTIHLILLRS